MEEMMERFKQENAEKRRLAAEKAATEKTEADRKREEEKAKKKADDEAFQKRMDDTLARTNQTITRTNDVIKFQDDLEVKYDKWKKDFDDMMTGIVGRIAGRPVKGAPTQR